MKGNYPMTKICPYCGEKILKNAIKCKHCREYLDTLKIIPNIQQIIENYIKQNSLKTNCITVGSKLTNELINQSGMYFEKEEVPLLLLFKKSLFFDLKTRILITDKRIYFKTLPDTFFIGLTCNFAKKMEGKCKIQGLEYLEIAEHDHAIGTAYIGHQLKINNDVVGLVRMGTSVEFDEDAIKYLNELFNTLADNNVIKNRVRNYSLQ